MAAHVGSTTDTGMVPQGKGSIVEPQRGNGLPQLD